jgi:hypothetical protein
MDAITKKICALLDRDDVELQCSAARVLGELGPASGEVRLCLAKHLATQNLTLKHYLLSALERVPGREALPYLFPILKEGGKVQERVIAIIASCGPAAVAEGRKLFASADEELRKLLVRIFGALGTDEGCGFLVGCIPDAGPELRRSICLALREAMGKMPAGGRKLLIRKIDALLASPRARASAEVAAAGIMLLGCAADPSEIGKLLRAAAAEQPALVREQALLALARIDIPGNRAREVTAALLPALGEADYANVVRHALAVLQRVGVPGAMAARLDERLRGAHPAVRSFILSRMSAVGSSENIARLLVHLNSGGFDERRAAQEALAKISGAAPQILKELDAAKDYEAGMRLVSILRALGARLGAPEKGRLFERMEKLRAAGDERSPVYAAALTAADPAFLAAKALGVVNRLKRAKAFAEADAFFGVLARHAPLTDELKFERAVVKLRRGLPDLASLQRDDDEALRLIAELSRSNEFPLLKRLKSEKALGPEELYHVGFHFAEKLFAQREFGVALLAAIAKKSARSRIGVAAKRKLELVGALAKK